MKRTELTFNWSPWFIHKYFRVVRVKVVKPNQVVYWHTSPPSSNHIIGYEYIWIVLYVAFCTVMAISRQKEARSRDYALLLFRMNSRVLYSAQYHIQHCTLHTFEQFGALYMHNHDDKYPARPRFESGTSRLQAPVDTHPRKQQDDVIDLTRRL